MISVQPVKVVLTDSERLQYEMPEIIWGVRLTSAPGTALQEDDLDAFLRQHLPPSTTAREHRQPHQEEPTDALALEVAEEALAEALSHVSVDAMDMLLRRSVL